jgi:long-chain acyl-CoA synthetase
MEHSAVKMVFGSNETASTASRAAQAVKPVFVNLDDPSFESFCTEKAQINLPDISDDSLALIVYTSGTTGEPKGVMLTHKNICFDAQAVIQAELISGTARLLALLPLHHTYPFLANLITPLFAGATVVLIATLQGQEILKAIKEENISVLVGVPQLYSMLTKGLQGAIESSLPAVISKRLVAVSGAIRRKTGINAGKMLFKKVHDQFGPSFLFFASGGAKLDAQIGEYLFALGFIVVEGYGLTETSPIVTFNHLKKQKLNSVGFPLPGVEVQIFEKDPQGIGEIAIRGANVMKGYYKNPGETSRVFRDGWFLSGDLGYQDKEGYLYITGRQKEVIVLPSGKNIYPEEIENHYLQSPAIKEICVTSAKEGSSLQAWIVPDMDYMKQEGVTNISERIRWEMKSLSSELPSFKRVKGCQISLDPLPRTQLGKIRRFLVSHSMKKPEAKVQKTEYASPLDTKTGKMIVDYLKTLSEKEVIRLDDNIELDLGLDSIQMVEMVTALEAMSGLRFTQDFFQQSPTVKDVIEYIEKSGQTLSENSELKTSWAAIIKDAALQKIMEEVPPSRTFMSRFFYANGLSIIRLAFKAYCGLEVTGQENLPKQEPFIITPNHVSYIDGFAIAAAVPQTCQDRLYFLGLEKFFTGSILGSFARFAQVIDINPETQTYRSINLSAYLLQKGKVLCIFPEGGRSFDGELMDFKKGVGILSKELNIPLVPVLIDGLYQVLPRGAWYPKPYKVRVIFGKPVYPKDIDYTKKPVDMDDYTWTVNLLREELGRMKSTKLTSQA